MKLPPARATGALAIATVAAYLVAPLFASNALVGMLGGFIPARASGVPLAGAVPAWLTPLTATLIHAGLFHLGMNLLMLVFCGRFVEPAVGTRGLFVLYGVGAYVAAAAQWA